jgi:hypothetical protein
MERFDIEKFKKNKDASGYWIYKKENGDSVFAQDTCGDYWEEITPKNSVFTTKSIYYPTGILKMKAVYFHDGGFTRNTKEYNEQGILVKETDYDAPYKDFSWEKVQEYCENRGIDLIAERSAVSRGKLWGIRYSLRETDKYHGKVYDTDTNVNIVLDIKTGKLIREYLTFYEESRFAHLAKDDIEYATDGTLLLKGLMIINNPQNKEQSVQEIEEKSTKQGENIMIAMIIVGTVLLLGVILYVKFLK